MKQKVKSKDTKKKNFNREDKIGQKGNAQQGC